jgi:hypothetical protein
MNTVEEINAWLKRDAPGDRRRKACIVPCLFQPENPIIYTSYFFGIDAMIVHYI